MQKVKSKVLVGDRQRPRRASDQFLADSDFSNTNRALLIESNETNPLGGATKEELTAVIAETFGADPDFEAPELAIAIDSLSRVITTRMAHADWPGDTKQLAVFMVSDRARDLAQTLNATHAPILDNGSRSITGKLWIATPTFASGYFATFVATDPAGVFQEIRAKGLGNRAALLFDPSATTPEIRYYPNGLSEDERVQRFSIANEVFSLDRLDRVLTQFHEDNIITPYAALTNFNPWSDGEKYFPRQHAEVFFQGLLKMVLSIAFGIKCRVDFEVRVTEGRCDLLITSRSAILPSVWVSHAAMELKVLRSFSSGGTPVSQSTRNKAVTDGLLQVIAYRRRHAAEEGMLCCYDMCLPRHCHGASIFDPVASRAKRNNIQLRNYRLYGTSADFRQDRYGAPSGAA